MTDLVPQVGFRFAFPDKLVSFLSPCVFPIVPGYVSYTSGVLFDDLGKPSQSHLSNILSSSTLFMLGLAIVIANRFFFTNPAIQKLFYQFFD